MSPFHISLYLCALIKALAYFLPAWVKPNTKITKEKAINATTAIPSEVTNTSDESPLSRCCLKRSYDDMKIVFNERPGSTYSNIQFILRYLNPINVLVSSKAICKVAGFIKAKFSRAMTSWMMKKRGNMSLSPLFRMN
jgi:hypothetical protein